MAEITLEQCDYWRERLIDRWPVIPQQWADTFSEFVARAVADERERCATVAAEMAQRFDVAAYEEFFASAENAGACSAAAGACLSVADAIRVGNQEPAP